MCRSMVSNPIPSLRTTPVQHCVGRIPANYMALFFQSFTPRKSSLPNLSAFLSNFTFSNPKCSHADFLLTGETKILFGVGKELIKGI